MKESIRSIFWTVLIIFLSLFFYHANDKKITADISLDTTHDKSNTPIDHVVVIFQGKRSFDNYFGTFPDVNGIKNNTQIPQESLSPGLMEYTISIWFKTSHDFSETGMIITKGGIGSDKKGRNMNFGIWMTEDEKIGAGFESNTGEDYFIYSSNKYNDEKWHNVLLSVNKTLLTLIIDQNEEINKNISDLPDTNFYPLRIGANFPSENYFFVGEIDELRIWNKSISREEVTTIHKNDKYNEFLLKHEEFNHENPILLKNDGINYIVLNDFLVLDGTNFVDINIKSMHNNWISPFKLTASKTDRPLNSQEVFLHSHNGGNMDGFYLAQLLGGHKNPSLVMGYYDNDTIPYYWELASQYVLADNFFGLKSKLFDSLSFFNNTFSSNPNITNSNQQTFVQSLEKNNISWKIYIENNDTQTIYKTDKIENIYNLTSYFLDLKNDFPNIAFIMSTDSRETSPKDVHIGNKFTASLIQALKKSKYWDNSALILTYSESGGWYDHVNPPSLEYSFRVPTLVISPYSKNNFIDHTLYSTWSIIKFLQDNFQLGHINEKIQNSNNLYNAFNFSKDPANPIIIEDRDLASFESGYLNKKTDILIVKTFYIAILISIGVLLFFFVYYKNIRKIKLP